MPGTSDLVLAGTTNFLAKYVNSADVGNSAVYETPTGVRRGGGDRDDDAGSTSLHVRFTNTGGQITGLAVQNLGSTAASYSGMLFYDQNGALGQFQGFNNVTHEYRINNIARNGSSVLDGSINFMIGGTSKFFVAQQRQHRHRHDRAVGAPRSQQCVPGGAANIWMTSYTDAVVSLLRRESQRHVGRADGRAEWRWPVRHLRPRLWRDGIRSCLDGRHDGASCAKLDGHGTGHRAQVHDHLDQCDFPDDQDDARCDREPRHRHHHRAGGRSPRSQQCLELGLDGHSRRHYVRQQCDRISGASAQSQRNRGESSRSAGQRQSRGVRRARLRLDRFCA